jgi:hypothetical protein
MYWLGLEGPGLVSIVFKTSGVQKQTEIKLKEEF